MRIPEHRGELGSGGRSSDGVRAGWVDATGARRLRPWTRRDDSSTAVVTGPHERSRRSADPTGTDGPRHPRDEWRDGSRPETCWGVPSCRAVPVPRWAAATGRTRSRSGSSSETGRRRLYRDSAPSGAFGSSRPGCRYRPSAAPAPDRPVRLPADSADSTACRAAGEADAEARAGRMHPPLSREPHLEAACGVWSGWHGSLRLRTAADRPKAGSPARATAPRWALHARRAGRNRARTCVSASGTAGARGPLPARRRTAGTPEFGGGGARPHRRPRHASSEVACQALHRPVP